MAVDQETQPTQGHPEGGNSWKWKCPDLSVRRPECEGEHEDHPLGGRAHLLEEIVEKASRTEDVQHICLGEATQVLVNPSLVLSWRRQWHPTLVLSPGRSHGQRSLVGCSPWGR